jgi:hypothetical protein
VLGVRHAFDKRYITRSRRLRDALVGTRVSRMYAIPTVLLSEISASPWRCCRVM